MAILIVEDNPVSAKLIDITLRKNDFETLVAEDGVQALEFLTNSSSVIDVVIADVMMPGMDGLTLAAKIKTTPGYAHIPVIICTMQHDVESIKKAASLGCRHYLLKPFRPEDLRAKILECLRQREKVVSSRAEIMSRYRMKDGQYAEIRTAFLQLLESHLALADRKYGEPVDQDLRNIDECAMIFGAERLKCLLEQYEMGRRDKTDNSELDRAILTEMKNVSSMISK